MSRVGNLSPGTGLHVRRTLEWCGACSKWAYGDFLIHCVLIFAVVSLLWRASRQGSGIRDTRTGYGNAKACHYVRGGAVSYLGSQLRIASGASNRNVAAGMAQACPSFEPGSLSGADASAQRKKWIHVDVARMTA